MKKIGLAVIAAAVGLSGVAFAPTAKADVSGYFSDLSGAGFHVSSANEAQVLALGEAVCIDMYNGRPVRQEMQDVIDMGFTTSEAAQFIAISVADLCPSMASRFGTGNGRA